MEDPEDDYNWRTIKQKFDRTFNEKFLQKCLQEGIYFHNYGTSPVPAHNGFGVQHTMEDIAYTLDKIDKIFGEIK